MKFIKSRIAAAVGALALLVGGLAVAQTVQIPYVTSLGVNDIVQVIKNANPTAGNTYASLAQLRPWIMGANSAHSGTPAVSSCGTGSPAIATNSTDYGGRVTAGTSATGCVITFSTAYAATPACVVVSQTAYATTTPAYTVSTTAITITQTSTSGNIYDYVCVAMNGG